MVIIRFCAQWLLQAIHSKVATAITIAPQLPRIRFKLIPARVWHCVFPIWKSCLTFHCTETLPPMSNSLKANRDSEIVELQRELPFVVKASAFLKRKYQHVDFRGILTIMEAENINHRGGTTASKGFIQRSSPTLPVGTRCIL